MKNVLLLLCLVVLVSLNVEAQEKQKADPEKKKSVPLKKGGRSKRRSNLGSTNLFRISALGLTNKLKLHYEKVISTRSAFGLTSAIYFSEADNGSMKIEPHYKYYLSSTAPSGTYFLMGPTVFLMNNYKFRYTASAEQQPTVFGETPLFNSTNQDAFITTFQQKSFTSIGGCLGFGYQFTFGKSNNFVLDFSAGYQYVPIPKSIKEPQIKEMTYQATSMEKTYKINYNFSEKKNFFGITSPIFTRLSVGVLF